MSKSQAVYKTVSKRQPYDNNSKRETLSETKSNRMRKREGVRQYSVHLRESIHRETKIALLMQGAKQDFSGLVEQLLIDYLAKQKNNGSGAWQ